MVCCLAWLAMHVVGSLVCCSCAAPVSHASVSLHLVLYYCHRAHCMTADVLLVWLVCIPLQSQNEPILIFKGANSAGVESSSGQQSRAAFHTWLDLLHSCTTAACQAAALQRASISLSPPPPKFQKSSLPFFVDTGQGLVQCNIARGC